MPKLYEILFCHHGPKDSESGIKEYVISDSEEKVMKYIDEKYNLNCWLEFDYPETDWKLDDPDDEEYFKKYPKKELVMKNKGELEKYQEDCYYGLTTYGWKQVSEELIPPEIDVLKRFIAEVI